MLTSQGRSRREFLQTLAAALAVAPSSDRERLIGTRPLLGTRPGPPLGRLLGTGLDARQFLDLSTLSSETLRTPTSRFYVRTRAPRNAAASAAIRIGDRRRAIDLALDALRGHEVDQGDVLIECAGNADPNNFGLISAAQWTGVPLSRALEHAGPQGDRTQVLISGRDDHPPSHTSVPGASWVFAVDHLVDAGAFLATAMNGEPLTADHGAPVRLIVPGWYGCACIKWVDEILFVDASEPATSQMQEFAVRTFQEGRPRLAREYRPVAIEHAATPVRVEQWVRDGRLEYRVIGILWGGVRATNKLEIRFTSREPWMPVNDCPLPRTTRTWSLWTHTWRPNEPGRYRIALRVNDPGVPTTRLDMFFYVRDVVIEEA